MRFARSFLFRLAKKFGFGLSAKDELAEFDTFLDLLLTQAGVPAEAAHAQLKQDIAALACNGFKRNGFFVDIGASDPVSSNNTVMLEREFGWDGICVEPQPMLQSNLQAQRRCAIDCRCVWATTGEQLPFHFVDDTMLSTLSSFVDCDNHAGARSNAQVGTVETVSLFDLLKTHGAPKHVDFLSLDTEGSELAILEAFDFRTTTFGFISVEHNFTPNREAIHALLSRNGYRRIWTRLSKWDDWFVRDGQETTA